MMIEIGIRTKTKALVIKVSGLERSDFNLERPMREGEPYAPAVRELVAKLKLVATSRGEKMIDPDTGCDFDESTFLDTLRDKFVADGLIWEAS